MFSAPLVKRAKALLRAIEDKGWNISLAESCTGGLVAALLTESAGASKTFTHGFVTYANEAKEQLLGVKAATLNKFGAVSEQTAQEMAKGALKKAKSDIAISITGIAGPGGGSKTKPVGLVFIAVATRKTIAVKRHQFRGNRHAVRLAAVKAAIALAAQQL